ncbi:MAG: hypothetical protein FD123_2483 [Bacteroidetes bacterium]|nr:MAG: hypothetical protein FD123_2483 [Bacteroidota bacterium]
MRFPLFIAFRYLFSKKSHNAINIITAISMVCVAVVSMALVIILSAMNGLSGLVETLYNSFNPDIRIVPAQGKTFIIDSAQTVQLKKIPGLAYYTEVLEENALLEFDDKQLIASVRGVSPDFLEMTSFDTLIREGRYDVETRGDQTFCVAGRGLVGRLGIAVEDGFSLAPLHLLVPKRGADLNMSIENLDEETFVRKTTYVSGAYGINDDFDFKFVIVPIEFARELYGYGKESSMVEIGLDKGANTAAVAAEMQKILGSKFVVKDRLQQNALLYKTLKSEKLWTFIILLFILLIAIFNITGSLTMLILEKKKDIGILWSMGADRQLIRRIFFSEGVLISILGMVFGILLGLLVCCLQIEFGFYKFGEGFVVDAYPVTIEGSDILYILLSVAAIGLLASWYPVTIFTRKYLTVKFS